ncbi:MAG: DUF1273 family protein [Clostridia bacterium]|nr:DUF1273 family protein [Clostridia bacterium]
MEIIKSKTCSFTGHRIVDSLSSPKIMSGLLDTCEDLIKKGFDTFISGGARGFDLLAAEAILTLKKTHPHIRLVMALPCRNQTQGWGKADKERYENILSLCDQTEYISENYFEGCMQIRNRFMINNSSICVAYLKNARGGTYSTVLYAKEQGIQVINLA